MRISERLDLNRSIAAELARRYSWREFHEFLKAFGLTEFPDHWDDEEDYISQVLTNAGLSVLSEITEDLGMSAFSETAPARQLPAMWKDDSLLRVFISHLSAEKEKATRLRDCMKAASMSAFVAHEDIEPIAQALGKDVLMFAHRDDAADVPFDVAHQQIIFYTTAKQLHDRLVAAIAQLGWGTERSIRVG